MLIINSEYANKSTIRIYVILFHIPSAVSFSVFAEVWLRKDGSM
jgi:hypothetical protein